MKFLLFNTVICLEEIIIVFLNYFWFDDRLCDNSIADILAAEGLNVARRTVAKYREELGIAPKNLRKRF